MADEENPLGGGPFGVGPFGPLVATAAAAAAAFSMVVVTTSSPAPRTLFYQANIKPPVVPAAVDNINAVASTTTGAVRTKTLFYQSKIYGIAPPVVVVDVTPAQWMVPFSRAPTRPPTETALYTPFVPQIAPQPTIEWAQPFRRQVGPPLPVHTQPTFPYQPVVVVSEITADQWLPRWRGPPSYLPAPAGGSPFVPKEAVLENTQTPDKWLPRWQGPPSYHPAPAGGSPFIPKEATRENTVTPDAWMPRWQKAVPPTRLSLSYVTYAQAPTAVSNLTTTLEWMPAWSGTKRPLLSLAGGVVNVPLPSNLTTTLEWQVAWRGPPNYNPAPQGGAPFVPKEAVLENTVTPEKWLFRWHAAVPVPPVHHTQPVFGYPYEAASNLTTTLEWMQRWQGPPRYWPIKVQALPFVPKADVVDQVTPDKWLIKWQGPPRYLIPLPGGSPFVAKEAVLENTVTPDKWLVRFAKAVPVPKPVPTQPVFGYPYETQAIVVPYAQWWHQPLSRAAARPAVHNRPYQPFVPKEAVAENTRTPDKWMRPLSVAVKRPAVWPTQPFFGYPYQAAAPVIVSASVSTQQIARKSLFYQARIQPYPPIVAPDNTVTPDKWLKPLGVAAKRPAVWRTQPFFGYPYEAAPADAIEGGPADEPERVICILPHSRVAVVPEVLRTATVPVDLREATVPELSRTVEVLFSERDEDSNQFTTLPCAGIIPEQEEDAFQDDAFPDDGFQ